MRVALIQVASPAEETIANRRARVGELVRSARGADLIVLPELWAVGYFAFDAYTDAAETVAGPTVTDASGLARELAAHIHVGSFVERLPNDRYRNTAVLIDPDGSVVHSYSKVHVFGYQSKEAQLLQPGGHLGISPTPFGRIASTTCYDLRFPELWRRLVDFGAQIVVVPAAWPAARREHWRLFVTARAVEQQVFVLGCNAVGTQAGTELGGLSRIVDPWGNVVAEAGTEEGITMCDIDPQLVDRVRHEFPVLADRLSDYGALPLAGGGI